MNETDRTLDRIATRISEAAQASYSNPAVHRALVIVAGCITAELLSRSPRVGPARGEAESVLDGDLAGALGAQDSEP